MKALNLLSVTLATMCTTGLMATSALALPNVSITLGGAYPLHTNFSINTLRTELQTVNGGILDGEGLHVLSLYGGSTALGTYRAIFLRIEKGVEKCFNIGEEANGEVLTEGSFHIVYTSLAGSIQGLQIGALFLPKELTGATEINCPTNANKIKLKGSLIGGINNAAGAGNTTQLTGVKGKMTGLNGKQEIRAYWNGAGTGLLAQFLSNVDGAGFKESNLVVEGEPVGEALEGKMFVISSR